MLIKGSGLERNDDSIQHNIEHYQIMLPQMYNTAIKNETTLKDSLIPFRDRI